MPSTQTPIARFYRLIEQTRPPMRADRSAAGTLPTRAYRYCEAVTSATGHGWWVFPPMGLRVMWDGADIFWATEEEETWNLLAPSTPPPAFAEAFDTAAPDFLAGCTPPMLTALPEPGTLQIWTGLMVRTRPGWHMLVRAPANLPGIGGISLYEGIVESDVWFGPLFTNLRFTRSHVPVTLRPDYPLVQLQPLWAPSYGDAVLDSMDVVPGMGEMADSDWLDYHRTIVVPNEDPDRPFGAYAKSARRRRKSGPDAVCPMRGAPAFEP